MENFHFGVIIPTYNPGPNFIEWIKALEEQTAVPDSIIVIDSSSTDQTAELARNAGFQVEIIPQECFGHARTRNQALELISPDIDIVVFLTQDAILADSHSLEKLVGCFKNEKVGTAYGRQLPSADASPLAAHARLFNYPEQGNIKSWDDREFLGLKAAFTSNSFAAHRLQALVEVGGFPENVIVSEDTFVSAKMLKAGWLNQYCAEACVFHSHNYSYIQEFSRYFDIGVFHARQQWIRQFFGHAEGEGKRFVVSEITYLWGKFIFLIPSALLRTVFKYLGFRLGLCEERLPNKLKKWLSMQKHYWLK